MYNFNEEQEHTENSKCNCICFKDISDICPGSVVLPRIKVAGGIQHNKYRQQKYQHGKINAWRQAFKIAEKQPCPESKEPGKPV